MEGGDWAFEPGSQPNTYKLRLVSNHHKQPGGWYLDAHRLDKAQRNHHSTWLLVHEGGQDSWKGDWCLEFGDGGSTTVAEPPASMPLVFETSVLPTTSALPATVAGTVVVATGLGNTATETMGLRRAQGKVVRKAGA